MLTLYAIVPGCVSTSQVQLSSLPVPAGLNMAQHLAAGMSVGAGVEGCAAGQAHTQCRRQGAASRPVSRLGNCQLGLRGSAGLRGMSASC